MYDLFLFLHLLLFVYWLGTDLGVFMLTLGLKNTELSYEQRSVLMRFGLAIDMGPRIAFALMFPVGLYLATELGLVEPGLLITAFCWTAAVVWISLEVYAFRRLGRPAAIRVYIILGIWMFLLFVVLTGLGTWSLNTGGPFESRWLSLKVLLFGLVFGVSLMMARYFAPLEAAMRRLGETGSTPVIEQQIRSLVNRGGIFVVLLFILLATNAYLGLFKPI